MTTTTATKPLAEMTKRELLEVAKSMSITGRHEMSKEDLLEAVANVGAEDQSVDEELDEDGGEDNSDLGEEPSVELDPKAVKDAKARYMSLAKRGPDNKVIRKGVKFNMNVPFREKLYYLSTAAVRSANYAEVLAAAPPQVQKIVAGMQAAGVTSPDKAMRGRAIVDAVKSGGHLTTKIESAQLFAYFRRVLERVGVVHAVDAGEGEEG